MARVLIEIGTGKSNLLIFTEASEDRSPQFIRETTRKISWEMWQCLAPEELGARAKALCQFVNRVLGQHNIKEATSWTVTVTGKGRENFSDCHLQALAQAPFELLRLSAQEEAFHDLRSVQLAAQDECIPDLAAFLGSGSQTVGFPCSPIKVFAIQDGGSSMLPSVAALERYAGLTGRLANERSCGMILLASGFAWGLSATNAEDMVASFDYEQAGEKIRNQLAGLFAGFSDLTSDLTEPLGQMELPEALQALQRFGENIRSSEQTA